MRKQCTGPLQLLLCASLLLTLQACAATQSSKANGGASTVGSPSDSAAAHHATIEFLSAFDSLKFEAFRDYLAEGVTMFFPFPQLPSRLDGRDTVAAVFGAFMRGQRAARERDGRPMVQGLQPRDLRVQMVGPVAAVASFHLGGEAPARRSIIFHRGSAGWKVVHWHASPAPASTGR